MSAPQLQRSPSNLLGVQFFESRDQRVMSRDSVLIHSDNLQELAKR